MSKVCCRLQEYEQTKEVEDDDGEEEEAMKEDEGGAQQQEERSFGWIVWGVVRHLSCDQRWREYLRRRTTR